MSLEDNKALSTRLYDEVFGREIRIDRFAGGRIVESWFIPDRLTLWQQWGLLPEPSERVCYCGHVGDVSGDRLASALGMRRRELWDTNSYLAERIEIRIKDAQRAH